MSESAIRLVVERLDEGGYVATSPDVQGLVVQGQTLLEIEEYARDVARKIYESCVEHNDPIPVAMQHAYSGEKLDLTIPIGVGAWGSLQVSNTEK